MISISSFGSAFVDVALFDKKLSLEVALQIHGTDRLAVSPLG